MPVPDKIKKKLLGEYLVETGLVTEAQVEKALAEQKKAGARLGQTLMELGYLKEDDLIVALAQQLNLAHIDISSYILKPEVVNLIPEEIARRYELIALEKVSDNLSIAMTDPLNVFAIDEVQKLTSCRIEPVICSRLALFMVFDEFYQKTPRKQKTKMPSPVAQRKAPPAQAEPRESMAAVDGQEIIELVDNIIRLAVSERATDIHIEPDDQQVRVRCRVDGFLREMKTFSKEIQLPMVSRIKVLAGMDIAEKRIPQDGRFHFKVKDKNLDLRVSTLPTVLGEKVVMRLLDKSMILIKLGALGFSDEILKQFEELIRRPYGMILVTGPTSSGKTTTLYSAINMINTIEKNILTVEDPVEYRLERVNQVQVNPRAGLTFATGLRAFLRQDPNVIMIGEIRDLETAEIAVQSSLTGHLVFSTIHTNNAPATITRLIDMKVESFLVAAAVVGVLAQRLIRTICPNCKEKFKPPPDLIKSLDFPELESEHEFYKGKGCEACKGSGYLGRIGIYELMMINDQIKELILKNASTEDLTRQAKQSGMDTLRTDGLKKVLKGMTTIDEVLRTTADEAKGK